MDGVDERQVAPARIRSPAEVLKTNAALYVAGQALAWAALLHAILMHDNRVALLFWANVCLPPLFGWATYRECRTAWRGLPDDALRDVSIPAAIVFGATLAANALTAQLY